MPTKLSSIFASHEELHRYQNSPLKKTKRCHATYPIWESHLPFQGPVYEAQYHQLYLFLKPPVHDLKDNSRVQQLSHLQPISLTSNLPFNFQHLPHVPTYFHQREHTPQLNAFSAGSEILPCKTLLFKRQYDKSAPVRYRNPQPHPSR